MRLQVVKLNCLIPSSVRVGYYSWKTVDSESVSKVFLVRLNAAKSWFGATTGDTEEKLLNQILYNLKCQRQKHQRGWSSWSCFTVADQKSLYNGGRQSPVMNLSIIQVWTVSMYLDLGTSS